MMNMLLSPLLAATVAADRHAEVWTQTVARAQSSDAGRPVLTAMHEAPVQVAPLAMAGDSRPAMPTHHPGDRPPPMRPPPGFGEPRHGPPYLRGLALTDAQEDRIFDILHRLAPELRRLQRESHKAREEMRTLARAEPFDDARAAMLADTGARAAAAIALIEARSEAAIWQVLTPEQRKQVNEAPQPEHRPPPSHAGMPPPR